MQTIILTKQDHAAWIEIPDSEHWSKRFRVIRAEAQNMANTFGVTVEIHDRDGYVLEVVTKGKS